MGIEKQQYDRPTFNLYFSSNGYDHTITCVEGVFVRYSINPNVWNKISSESRSTLQVLTYESQGPFNIKQIWERISRQYTALRSRTQRDKATRYGDSLYLNIKKSLAPIYTEITKNYKNAIEAEIETSEDQATKEQLDVVLKELERENGPNIAEIENERFRSQLVEGFLYGIPAIVCIVLIIKKIRS